MTEKSKKYQFVSQLQQVCLKQNIPFVSYRLPLDTEITTLVQYQSSPTKLASLQNLDHLSGFVIAPFDNNERNGIYLLTPDRVVKSANLDELLIGRLANVESFLCFEKDADANLQTTTATDFISQVNRAVEAMNAGEFHKVVLSKVRLQVLPTDFNPELFFQKLCYKYPHAMVYLIQLPGVGCWMGATPEPLLIIENERVKTVSLAGTQISTGTEITDYKWSTKEMEEQGIVTDFVEQTLQSMNIESISKVGPVNYQAANLIHLKTAFEFPQNELNNRLGDFLEALHPTPSVGGLPKTEARNFILANEQHNRSYYTGFLGPINIENKTDIFVNLRCLQLFEKEFVLYSGAGITTSSVAEREWEETDNKMMTMMNVMMTPNP
jgi:isochorismate synthase